MAASCWMTESFCGEAESPLARLPGRVHQADFKSSGFEQPLSSVPSGPASARGCLFLHPSFPKRLFWPASGPDKRVASALGSQAAPVCVGCPCVCLPGVSMRVCPVVWLRAAGSGTQAS